MGILCVGIGLGGVGDWGALFHAVNHSLTKAALFLLAGNLLAAYGTKNVADVRGALRSLPWTGASPDRGPVRILGAPPFGAFSSELTILRAAVDSGSWVVVSAYSILLFGHIRGHHHGPRPHRAGGEAGSGGRSLRGGRPRPRGCRRSRQPPRAFSISPREPFLTLAAPLVLLALTAILGFFIPGFLDGALRRAALLLGA